MLDSQTMLILAALVFGLQPLLMWWQTRAGEPDSSTAWWGLGGMVAGISLVLLGVRDWVPIWAGAHLPNSGLIIALVLWAQSLRVGLGQGWRPLHLAWTCVGAFVYYSLTFALLDASVRIPLNRLVMGAQAMYVAWLAWQSGSHLRSHNAKGLVGCYLVLGLGLWISAWGALGTPVAFSPRGVISQIPSSPALLTLMTATVGSFCYLGMMLERSARQTASAIQARGVAEENARLDAKLHFLDRHRRLVLVSGSIAHELNQPLTAALTQAQLAGRLLQSPQLSPAGLQDMLGKATFNVLRTNEILDRIRAASHAKTLAVKVLDLRQVLDMSLGLMQVELQDLKIQVESDIEPVPMWCRGDEVGLSQVLVNLLRNAAQATAGSPDTRLVVRASCRADDIVVVVQDHGPGVPADVLQRWGEPFVSTGDGGLGLGLAISREIMEQHAGRMVLRNNEAGGAEVTLTLARCEAPA